MLRRSPQLRNRLLNLERSNLTKASPALGAGNRNPPRGSDFESSWLPVPSSQKSLSVSCLLLKKRNSSLTFGSLLSAKRQDFEELLLAEAHANGLLIQVDAAEGNVDEGDDHGRLQGSVGRMTCTSQPNGRTSRMRLGSTILTSDSPAKNVVIRMLLKAVLTMA